MSFGRHARIWLPAALIAAVAILPGCAAKKPPWGDPESGVLLTYRIVEGEPLKYEVSRGQTQSLEVMGQSVKVESSSDLGFTVLSNGLKEGNHDLTLTIDSMTMNISSPQFQMSPEMDAVVGKSFGMILSRLGKEVELSGADAIEYDLGPQGKRNVGTDFQAIFPDLADRPVRVGDTWNSSDTITEKSDQSDVQINLESVNTLDGFETIDGMECARITAAVKGTLSGTGKQGEADLTFDGTIEGTDTWYFAYEQGLFVKLKTEARGDSEIVVSGPQNMTIPMKQEINIELRLVR